LYSGKKASYRIDERAGQKPVKIWFENRKRKI
jgi:hypothetical protein